MNFPRLENPSDSGVSLAFFLERNPAKRECDMNPQNPNEQVLQVDDSHRLFQNP